MEKKFQHEKQEKVLTLDVVEKLLPSEKFQNNNKKDDYLQNHFRHFISTSIFCKTISCGKKLVTINWPLN